MGRWMPDAGLDSEKGPGMAGDFEAEKLLFVGTFERPRKALDPGGFPKNPAWR
jgi:hypothetical protein